MTRASLVAVARHLLFVRETEGPNRGAWVHFLQRYTGGQVAEPWCCDFVSVVLDIAYHGKAPLFLTGSTRAMLTEAKANGYVVTDPLPEDLYFFVNASGSPHHVGIVSVADPLTGIAGNTSPDGLSSNGTGAFEHVLSPPIGSVVFVRLPTVIPNGVG